MAKQAKLETVTITVPSGKVSLTGNKMIVAEAVGLICHSHLCKWIDGEVAKGRKFEDAKADVVKEVEALQKKIDARIKRKRRGYSG